MKKIVPFRKEIIFKTNLSEIVSIALEHNLHLEDRTITGQFDINGEYKMTETSVNTDTFAYNLPFKIAIDEKYNIDNVKVDIDDFYYEVINNNILEVNIDVAVNNLEEKITDEKEEFVMEKRNEPEDLTDDIERNLDYQPETIDEGISDSGSLFASFDSSKESYTSYKIYIVRDEDSLDSILEKYDITKEILEQYNDIDEIKIGDKLIIPNV